MLGISLIVIKSIKKKEFLCTQYFKTGTYQGKNIEVTRMPSFHELHLCSSGGKKFGEGVADKFQLSSREELWKEDLEGHNKAKKSKGKKPKPVGLQSGEQNGLSLLSQDILSDILDYIGKNLCQDNIPEDQQLPNIFNENEKLCLVLTDRNFHLLEDI